MPRSAPQFRALGAATPAQRRAEADRRKLPRLRGRANQERRKRWFHKHPLCVECLKAGRICAATELDHRVPISQGGADEDSNLQGLCHDCHAAKTTAERQALHVHL